MLRDGQAGSDGADQMVHRRKGLHHKQLRDAHRAGHRNAANVVAHQVNDHQVFSAILRRGRQLFRLLAIGQRIRQPGQSTFDGPSLNAIPLQMDKPLWRQAQDGPFLKTHEGAERRAVAGVEAGERLPLIAFIGSLKALGQIDLIAVAALQISLHPGKFIGILRWRHIGAPAGGEAKILANGGQLRLQPGKAGIDVAVAQQRNTFLMVVDNHRPVIEPHRHIRQGDVGLRLRGQVFKASTQIVAK